MENDFEGWLEAYTELQRQYSDLRNEYAVVIRCVIKTLNELGMWPVDADRLNTGKIMKTISALAMDAMMPGHSMKERFSFIGDLLPIAEKYRHIDVNDL